MDQSSPTVVRLPFPPSVNNLFLNVRGRGRVPSARYRDWRQAASTSARAQQPAPVEGRVSLSFDFRAPDRRLRDLDNLLKAPIDLLVSEGLIGADNNSVVRELRARWVDAGDPLTVTIRSAA